MMLRIVVSLSKTDKQYFDLLTIAMALEMETIVECDVIDLMMWVVVLSSKGKCL